ncbi:Zinc finger MYND domain-containing protein 15 [Schistosoma japonicum]|nr:Zinc finger MYND domain-containing protein 15 [Schistosoma japonicum]
MEQCCVACCVCGKKISVYQALYCPQCKALFYCSDKCRADDWISSSNPDHRHQQWCSRMKVFMDFEPVLQNLPFTFAPITTAPDFSWIKLDQILSYFGVNRQGLWKYEFPPTSYSRSCQISPDLWTTTTMDSEKHASTVLSSFCSASYEDALIRAFCVSFIRCNYEFIPIMRVSCSRSSRANFNEH